MSAINEIGEGAKGPVGIVKAGSTPDGIATITITETAYDPPTATLTWTGVANGYGLFVCRALTGHCLSCTKRITQ